MKKLRLLSLLLIVSLPLLLSVVACDDAGSCKSYCHAYWASDPAQYQACMEDCAR